MPRCWRSRRRACRRGLVPMSWPSCWKTNRASNGISLIALGLDHLERSARGKELTVWHLRAEIAALHTLAPSSGDTDWPRIVAIYDQLHDIDPSPVVELARAVALGRARGPAEGLAALPAPHGNPYGHAATAIFLTELGRTDEARDHFEKARDLARTEPERRLLERRLRS